MAKGAFTQLIYEAQGVALQEAQQEGIIVGLPLFATQKKRIPRTSIDDAEAAELSASTVKIVGDFIGTDFVTGDMLNSIRLHIKKTTETDADRAAIDMVGESITVTEANYGSAGTQQTPDYVVEATAKQLAKKKFAETSKTWGMTYAGTTATLTIGTIDWNDDWDGIPAVGDTVYAKWNTAANKGYFLVTAVDATTGVITMTWKSGDQPLDRWDTGITSTVATIGSHSIVTAAFVTLATHATATRCKVTIETSDINGVEATFTSDSNKVATITFANDVVFTSFTTGDDVTIEEITTPATSETVTVADCYYDYTGFTVGLDSVRTYSLYADIVAYRTSVKGMYPITAVGDIVALFGKSSLSNPRSNLGMGAYLFAASNGFKDRFRICALDCSATSGNISDYTADISAAMADSTLWATAIPKMKPYATLYHLVPLTGDDTIVSLYKEYAVSSSATDQKREKHLYAAQPIIGLGLSVETDGGDVSEVDDIVAAFGNTYYGLTEYEDVLTNKYIDDLLEIDGTHALRLSKTESIELAAGVPGGYDCERMTLIGNEYACIGDVIIEGHYIAAIVAGWRASQEIGYVLTNVGVPLITSLPSAEWYDTDDMEVLANAGWFMLYQEMVGGPIINYWQKTTAQDILEKKEQSLVIGLDHVAKTIRDTVDPTCIAKGLANRISTVNPNAPTNIRFLRKVNNALAGPKHYYCVQKEFLADFKVVAVTPNTATRDATDIKVEVSHLYPNNTLNTYIYVV